MTKVYSTWQWVLHIFNLTIIFHPVQEKDLLTTKVLRLEDSIEDLKAKLSAALSDKDRLIQVSHS